MKNATLLQRFEFHNSSYSSSYLKRRTDKVTVFIKREDRNLTGSHKDRGIWPLIEYYTRNHPDAKKIGAGKITPTLRRSGQAKSQKHFVISSSGNAAVSAAYCCKKYSLGLDIFVGRKIPSGKLRRLFSVIASESDASVAISKSLHTRLSHRDVITPLAPLTLRGGREAKIASKTRNDRLINIHQSQFPRRDAFRFAKEFGAQLISTSIDDHCLDGYAKIVKELPKDVDAIFVPASSGALAVGIFEGYKKTRNHKNTKSQKYPPRFFVCQTPRVHPFIDVVSANGSSIADAISDVIGERKSQIHSIIQTTKGAGVIVEDRYIKQAMKILKKELRIVKPSPNGSLAFAGLLKLSEDSGLLKGKKIVCLYTGM